MIKSYLASAGISSSSSLLSALKTEEMGLGAGLGLLDTIGGLERDNLMPKFLLLIGFPIDVGLTVVCADGGGLGDGECSCSGAGLDVNDGRGGGGATRGGGGKGVSPRGGGVTPKGGGGTGTRPSGGGRGC